MFPPGAFQFRSELQSVRLYQSTGGLHVFVMASEAIYFFFIIYYMFVQVCNRHNLNLLSSLATLIKFLTRTPLVLTGKADEAAEICLFQE